MSTATPARIVELWPSLPEDARQKIVDLAESSAANSGTNSGTYEFTAEELAGIERGREDFQNGRTCSLPEYRSDMDDFFKRLRAKSSS